MICRLGPVNSVHLAGKKSCLRCAVKLLAFREFIYNVPNILKFFFFNEAISIKITIWTFFDVPDAFREVILDFY